MKAFVIFLTPKGSQNSQKIILKTNIDGNDVKTFTIMQILKPASVSDALFDDIRTGTVWNYFDFMEKLSLLQAMGLFTINSIRLEDNKSGINLTAELPVIKKVQIDVKGEYETLKINGNAVVGLSWTGYLHAKETLTYETLYKETAVTSAGAVNILSKPDNTLLIEVEPITDEYTHVNIESDLSDAQLLINEKSVEGQRWHDEVAIGKSIEYVVRDVKEVRDRKLNDGVINIFDGYPVLFRLSISVS